MNTPTAHTIETTVARSITSEDMAVRILVTLTEQAARNEIVRMIETGHGTYDIVKIATDACPTCNGRGIIS